MNKTFNIKDLRTELKRNEFSEAKIKADSTSILQREVNFSKNILTDKNRQDFYFEVKNLLESGIDLISALELVKDGLSKKRKVDLVSLLVTGIIKGGTLSDTMESSGQFSTYEYKSVQVGEETGKMLQVLGQLASFYQGKVKQKRQIISALTYPILVLTIAFLAVIFMITYVVPMFTDIFKRFGGELPEVTKAVIFVSISVKKYFIFFFLIVAGILLIFWFNRKRIWFRNWSTLALLKIPLIGSLINKIYMARFSNTMAMLIGSKVPLLQSLILLRQMISFYPIENSILKIEENILAGISLNRALSNHELYPKKMISLIKVGEETNQLDIFFKKISEQYTEEVEFQTSVLSKFIEPVIIIILGLVVGVILIAMYLPLFQLGQNI